MRAVSLFRAFAFPLFVFGLTMVLSLHVNGQYAYTNTDKAAILKNRKLGAAAFQTYDRNTMYKVGLFFESIYKKYTDTSMRSAISYYQASVYSEGELYDHSLKAAFHLGQIYELGIGTPVNFDKAAIYYLISGGQGKNNLAAVVKKVCPSDSVLHELDSPSSLNDSLAIRFHPFCQLQQAATIAVLNNLASLLKVHTQATISVSIEAPKDQIAAYYEYWKQAVAFKRIGDQVQRLLVERGVSLDRFNPLLIDVSDAYANCTLIIRIGDTVGEK